MRKRIVTGSVLVASVAVVAACGTLFNASTHTVAMGSTPSGAEVWVDGNRMGETPVSLELDNHESHTVVFRMDGYEEVTCELKSSAKAGWIVLDILGGLLPVIVDAATGEWRGISQGVCNVTLPQADDGDDVASVVGLPRVVELARRNNWVMLQEE